MLEHTKLWETALNEIELAVSKANFNTWFKDTFIIKEEDGVVEIGVPNLFVKDWLHKKYHSFILKTLREMSDHVRAVEYIIAKNGPKKESPKSSSEKSHSNTSSHQLPLGDVINKEDNLNPRYTFETFVVGPFNELAYAAAQAIMKQPGAVYNPFFIHGGTGHGKTHLLQAVGNHIKHHFRDKKVHYITSEKFTTDLVHSIQSNKVDQFKAKYRRFDVLIMDDVQFFSGKDKTQEELFHLFNSLYENNKQIIFSSDKHPNMISGLEDRLLSRLKQGMIVDIPKPDHESRMAILATKSKHLNLTLDQDILSFLAEEIAGNIREIEGTLNTLYAHTELKGRPLTIGEIKNLIKDSVKPKKNISVKELIKTISDFYNIDEAMICNKNRRKEVVKPRQVIMYILREDFNISYPTIGEKLGGRDHTTVIHSCEKIKEDLKTDSNLASELHQIRSIIKTD